MNVLDCSMEGGNNKFNTCIKDSSFILKIKYNQNHSIQGTIQWLEQKKTTNFRSLMELIMLLHEAVSSNMDLRSWSSENGILKELMQMEQNTAIPDENADNKGIA